MLKLTTGYYFGIRVCCFFLVVYKRASADQSFATAVLLRRLEQDGTSLATIQVPLSAGVRRHWDLERLASRL